MVVLIVWYRKRTGKFHVEKSKQAQFEVDNDLYGFSRQHEDVNVNGGSETSKPQNYEYDTSNEQEAVQANNPMYDSEHRDLQVNPLYGDSNAQDGTPTADAVYSNIGTDTHKIQMDTDNDYAYCKH